MRTKIALVLALVLVAVVVWRAAYQPFPSDRTPEGAYARIARVLSEDHVKDAFPYLETEAQWAAHTIRDVRSRACVRVRGSYPESERQALVGAYCPLAEAADGADVFAILAKQKGWTSRLRRDLSGVASVDIEGERATVVTARGTRYPFHRRENGIWGLTIFTAELVAESQRASRDLAVVTAAADDYDRASHP